MVVMAEDVAMEANRLRDEVVRLQERVSAQQAALDKLEKERYCGRDGALMNGADLLWRACPPLGCGVVRPHLVILGNTVYVGGGNTSILETSRRVHKFVAGSNEWESLPITPYFTFALSTVAGQLTIIGGINILSSLTSADLLTFDGNINKWKKTLPAMPTKRCAASATTLHKKLVVTGGIGKDGSTYLDTVEVLDSDKLEWTCASSLPKPTSFMSITSCEATNRIYLLGGLTKHGSVRSVFSCFLKDLVASASQVKSEKGEGEGESVWEVLTETPYHRMGCLAMKGRLVVASGLDQKDKTTRSVHVFDPTLQKWDRIGAMPASRSSCSLASLGEGRLMVVGGYLNPSNWMTSLTTDVIECVNMRIIN